MCRPLDVLVVVKGAGVANTNFAPDEPACIGRQLMAVRALPNLIDPMYLYFVLASVRQHLKEHAIGATVPGLSIAHLENLIVPIRPLPEQRRIAARLREQLAEVEKARAAVQAQIEASRTLHVSHRRSVFTSSAGTPWPRCPLGELVDNYDGQRVPIRLLDRASRKGPYPYYGASGIIDHINDYIFDGEYLLIAEDGANLVNRSTPIAFKANGKFWVNNHAHVVRPKAGILLGYIEHFLAGTDIRDHVTGSAQPKLSQASLNALLVPVPPMPEQSAIVTALSTARLGILGLAESLSERLSTLDHLPAALLREAFAGRI